MNFRSHEDSGEAQSAVEGADLSIIVPTLNSETGIAILLDSIKRQSTSPLETLVIDGGSTDNTLNVANRFGARTYLLPGDRAFARDSGARLAKGNVLLFLDSDMELTPGVLEECTRSIRAADALYLREVTAGAGFWTRARALERDRYFKSATFEACRCIRRSVFDLVGGYESRATGLEDIDLQASLKKRGASVSWVDAAVIHHEENITLRLYLAKRRGYARADELVRARHPDYWREFTSPIARLRVILRNGGGRKLVRHPLLLFGLALSRSLETYVRIRAPGR